MSDAPARKPRRISFWMTVSLLFNLLLLGLVAGMLVRQLPDQGRADDRPRLAQEVSPETRRAMFGLMRDAYRETKPLRDARDAARRNLAEALKAEPFDADQVSQAFADLRAADNSVHAATHQAMIGRLAALPPEQRIAMGELLSRGPDRNRGNSRPRRRD